MITPNFAIFVAVVQLFCSGEVNPLSAMSFFSPVEVNVRFCFWQKKKVFPNTKTEPTLIQDGKLCLEMVLDSVF